ncbi:MAG: deoxyribodipyrimidine photo-lyase [Candidatus Eisenbacteria bacterium]|nr:deoxyribodipyrimidine photo-lyase [Candidatus Eisenbacteria bacterium]
MGEGRVGGSLVWFRDDLRLRDHPPLRAANRRGGPIVPVFVWPPTEDASRAPGAVLCWWLHHSLEALAGALGERGLRLILRRGRPGEVLRELAEATGADALYCSESYAPAQRAADQEIDLHLERAGVRVQRFHSNLLLDPYGVRTRAGDPYRVFTPFWKSCLQRLPPEAPSPLPRRLTGPRRWPASESLAALELLPRVERAEGLQESWKPGEEGGRRQLARFVRQHLAHYALDRDRPDLPHTSRLSPHLRFGELSPREVWHAVARRKPRGGRTGRRGGAAEAFLRQLGWREFAHHLLVHFPHTPEVPLRPEFARFPWRTAPADLRAWQRGCTGFPIVDAGMRQLWHTGWMHNRVRMIAASFLVKDLLLPWKAGADWFWETLVDADLANNTLGWQWTAGCGADAAPFFRIFNPVTQGRRYDPDGDYVRRWVPELARGATEWIHHPWDAPRGRLEQAGVRLGRDYPHPIVDHGIARERALSAFARLRGSTGNRPR